MDLRTRLHNNTDLTGCEFESQDGLTITALQKVAGSTEFWMCDEGGAERTTRTILSEEYLTVSCKELPTTAAAKQGRVRCMTRAEIEESMHHDIEPIPIGTSQLYMVRYYSSSTIPIDSIIFHEDQFGESWRGHFDSVDMYKRYLTVAPLVKDSGDSRCTCGAAAIRGIHSDWCDN